MKKGLRLSDEVYRLVSRIPEGKLSTYGSLARAVNRPKAPRAIGAILRANPHPKEVVPCHRVIMSDGKIGGYGGKNGIARKISLLRKEGVRVVDGRVDLQRYLFTDF